jgi:predicted MPP superfamily phosphohydrolase
MPTPAQLLLRLFLTFFFLGIVEYYAFQSVKTVTANFSDNTQRITNFIWWSVPILFVCFGLLAAFSDMRTWAPGAKTMLQASFVLVLVAKLVMSTTMLIDDLRRAGTFAVSKFTTRPVDYSSRSKFLATAGIFLAGVPFATLTYGMLRNMYRFTFHRVNIPVPNLAEGLQNLKIIQLSDIHSGSFTKRQPLVDAIKMINDQEPDIVFFTGDLVNNTAPEIEQYLDVFGKIKAKYGVFSVLGNHDYGDYQQWASEAAKTQNLQDLFAHHKTMGWNLLLNENRILDINGAKLAVLGVENFGAKMNFHKHGQLDITHAGTNDADMRILLSHDPSHWDYEVNSNPTYKNIELTLSGHTHGFQFGIEIPGWVKWSPSQYAYKQWADLYQTGKQFLYVNRGFGVLGYPGRVGILPEITILTLQKA